MKKFLFTLIMTLISVLSFGQFLYLPDDTTQFGIDVPAQVYVFQQDNAKWCYIDSAQISTGNINTAIAASQAHYIDTGGGGGGGSQDLQSVTDIDSVTTNQITTGGVDVYSGDMYMYDGSQIIIANNAKHSYFFGLSGNFTETGLGNIVFGYQSMQSNTTGKYNTVIGYQAMQYNTTGYYNVANGTYALYKNTTGQYNVAVGYQAMKYNTTGKYNTSLGTNALYSNTTAKYNVAMGYGALNYTTTGSYNTAVGGYAGRYISIGQRNAAFGYNALGKNKTGNDNTGIGYYNMYYNDNGNYNTCLGSYSLENNKYGSNNSVFGYLSLGATLSSSNTTSLGYKALKDVGYATVAGNLVIGQSYQITVSGTTDWTLIGSPDNFVGTIFTATGVGEGTGQAKPNYINNNTAVGSNTGWGIVTGQSNTIIGANVQGLDQGLSNNIILSDGDGNIQYQVDEDGLTTVTNDFSYGDNAYAEIYYSGTGVTISTSSTSNSLQITNAGNDMLSIKNDKNITITGDKIYFGKTGVYHIALVSTQQNSSATCSKFAVTAELYDASDTKIDELTKQHGYSCDTNPFILTGIGSFNVSASGEYTILTIQGDGTVDVSVSDIVVNVSKVDKNQ